MKTIAAILAVLSACFPAPAQAVDIIIQAESYSESYNLDVDQIRPVSTVLYGLGAPGEWTQYEFAASAFGTYEAVLVCWGEVGVAYSLSLTIWDGTGGEGQTILFSFIGKGECGL